MDKNLPASAGDTDLNLCGNYWVQVLQPLKLMRLEPCAPQQEKVMSLSRFCLFATPWTVAHWASPSMGFSRHEYWSGLPFPSPGESSQTRDRTWVSCIAGRRFTLWATRDNKKSHHNEKPTHLNEEQLMLNEKKPLCSLKT